MNEAGVLASGVQFTISGRATEVQRFNDKL